MSFNLSLSLKQYTNILRKSFSILDTHVVKQDTSRKGYAMLLDALVVEERLLAFKVEVIVFSIIIVIVVVG